MQKSSKYEKQKNPNCHCAMENVLILNDWYFRTYKQNLTAYFLVHK